MPSSERPDPAMRQWWETMQRAADVDVYGQCDLRKGIEPSRTIANHSRRNPGVICSCQTVPSSKQPRKCDQD
eukprot:9433943-Alexandrium_andersonii.AAC.1